MNAADRRRLTPALGIVAALLAVLLIALWAGLGRGARWHDGAASPPRLPPAGDALPAPAVPPLAQYVEVWQHPLFSPTRSPEAVAPGAGEASGDLQLTGVIMLPGVNMAILHDKTSGRDYRVLKGQASRDGPLLVELHPRSAVVESGGSRLQLQLIPGPSPDAGNVPEPQGGAQPVPMQGPGAGSAMVSGPAAHNPERAADAAAAARALKARIEAQRRRAQQQDGGQ